MRLTVPKPGCPSGNPAFLLLPTQLPQRASSSIKKIPACLPVRCLLIPNQTPIASLPLDICFWHTWLDDKHGHIAALERINGIIKTTESNP